VVTVGEIFRSLSEFAPLERKMDFDNVGFLVGFQDAPVSRALVALDITDEVVAEAIECGAQLIVSHHPLFFNLKSVTDTDRIGRKVTALLKNGVSAICMHTNLDAANGGVNDALAKAAGLENVDILHPQAQDSQGQAYSCNRIGRLPSPMPMAEYLPFLKERLRANGLRYHDAGRPVSLVAVVGGAGGGDLEHAIAAGCDTFISSDIKYDTFLAAKEAKINLIDADHFCTENVVTPVLEGLLKERFPQVLSTISKRHGQTSQFFVK